MHGKLEMAGSIADSAISFASEAVRDYIQTN